MCSFPRVHCNPCAALLALGLPAWAQAALTGLLITEIHYNAPETPTDGAETYEFIEFHNPTQETLDLTGVRIVSGVTYTFPAGTLLAPGAFAIAPASLSLFTSRYSTPASPWYHPGIAAYSQFSAGKLNNAGERILVTSSTGVTLVDLTYGDSGDWPSLADGNGPSVELRNPQAAPADPAARMLWLNDGDNWRSTSLLNGTPGRAAEEPAIDLEVSELLAHSNAPPGLDWIELHNNGEGSLTSLNDIFLSDSWANLARARLGSHVAALPADGYAVIDENQMGFALSELGDKVIVSQILPNGRTYLLDHVDFSETDRDVTMGLYRRIDGGKELTAMSEPTHAERNAYPFISPVVITEIMYAPINGVEFIELTNRTQENVPLYDPDFPANTWQFTSGITYTFPPGIVLAPGESILVCNTAESAFRQAYPVAPEARIFGPWDLNPKGTALLALNNSGETLRLRRPGPPQPPLLVVVPMVIMEKLAYESGAPWPTGASATGLSIERLALYGYGNDGNNWMAAAPSPGTASGQMRHLDIQVDTTAAGLLTSSSAIPGRYYNFEYSGSPGGPWTPWQTVAAPGNIVQVQSPYAEFSGVSARFHRIRWLFRSDL